MLHALLHGKLDPVTLEPERREDALTSTVFGTLMLVEAWDVLARWLGVTPPDRDSGDPVECWFWPRLGSVEPDVVLRLGGSLMCVEAKYRSSRHDLELEVEDERPSDQLVRQYNCLKAPMETRSRYPEPINRAINECNLFQIYLVDARRLARARRQCDESRRLLPTGSRLQLVTWQELYRLLGTSAESERVCRTDLRRYLRLARLDTFEGLRVRLAPAVETLAALRWRAVLSARGLRRAMAPTGIKRLAPLLSWRATSSRSRFAGLFASGHPQAWVQAVRAWRFRTAEEED